MDIMEKMKIEIDFCIKVIRYLFSSINATNNKTNGQIRPIFNVSGLYLKYTTNQDK